MVTARFARSRLTNSIWGRTHKYVTLVIDLESGRIIWVEQGRGSQALREFWRRFKLSGARLKAVAMGMSAHAASVRAHAPHAMITFDRFQWLPWHCDPELLGPVLTLNEPLQCASLLKEELGELWEQKDGGEAWGFLRECAPRQKPAASGNSMRWPRPPSPCQGSPELLQDRADQRKNGRHQPKNPPACWPAPSASVTRISSTVLTLSMKLSSNSSAKTKLSR